MVHNQPDREKLVHRYIIAFLLKSFSNYIQSNLHLPGLLGESKKHAKWRDTVNRIKIYDNLLMKPLFGRK